MRVDQRSGQLHAAAILRRTGFRPTNLNVPYGGAFPTYTLNENLAVIRHRAQEANDVALKVEASPRLCGSRALFDGRLLVDLVYDLHLTIRGLFPGTRRGNCQLGALGATMNGERGRWD